MRKEKLTAEPAEKETEAEAKGTAKTLQSETKQAKAEQGKEAAEPVPSAVKGVMIGIEIHCQVNTKSKLFCSDSTDLREAKPNENTCPICLGFPGAKPKLNRKVIDYGIMTATALGCRILDRMYFSRKSYFYPDLSKNFQITQYEIPLAVDGHMDAGGTKIRIRRVHAEEDPAKLTHVGGNITSAKYVLADYNRSGIPLLEIVTDPDFTSPRQVRLFLQKLSSMLEHLGVYDSSGEASLRVDANISLDGGERVEVKNITGFANVEKALSYEIVRQRSLVRNKIVVQRETRHFDADRKMTVSLRKKEFEEEYGYIFEPDLPEIEISEEWKSRIMGEMPELPEQRVARFMRAYGLTEYQSGVLVYTDKNLADFFEKCCAIYASGGIQNAQKADSIAKWMITFLLKSLNWNGISVRESKARPETFVELVGLIDGGKITERYAKELIKEYVDTGVSPEKIFEKNRKDKSEMSGKGLEETVRGALKENSKALKDYLAGNGKAMEFLVGQVLKKTGKQADPKKIRELIEKAA